MRQIADIFRTFLTLALPYFRSEEKWQARGLLAGVVVAEFGVVYALVAFNHWNGYFFNAIQDRNWNAFLFSLLLFAGIAAWTVLATMLQFYFGQMLILRWRRWLTERFVDLWMADGRHYRVQLQHPEIDNAHLRIANDILIFMQRTYEVGQNFLGSMIALASFAYILWQLSSVAPLVLFGVDLSFPGYLFWIAIAYAGTGTLIAHLIGKPLIRLNFNQQRFESDYRFGIVRVLDHSEQVALLRGEDLERRVLDRRFTSLVKNWVALIGRQTGLTAFTTGYSQISFVFPFVMASPAYFAGVGFGRRRVFGAVSPHKTLEGALAGLALPGLLAFLAVRVVGWPLASGAWPLAGLAVWVSAAGILGDLTESLIKRAQGVKDSSGWLPGHGGLLDKLDSLLFAAPAAYYGLRWL
jgi:putative ATP-binding cassette transporter